MNAVAQDAVTPAASRFIDNADGTVTDTRLNLMWSKDTLCKKEVNHAKAEKLCSELELAGHSDWRLPTAEELFPLADRTRRQPAIDTDVFPDTKSDWYWTSTISAFSSDYAWYVSFDFGSAGDSPRDYVNAFVRAVRSLPPGQ